MHSNILNILVTGSNGQLGSEIKDIADNYPCFNFFFTDFKELDITDFSSLKIFLNKNYINAIINCAAFTNVEDAEENLKLANQVNCAGVENLATLSKKLGIKFIHISTDYVFDGKANIPYEESFPPNPQSAYGLSKLNGELAMKKINPKDSIIIRTSWVYSIYGKNFVKTMINLAKKVNEISVISDQIGSPTYANDLAKVILDNINKLDTKEVQVYHYTNEGSCSWFDFANEIFKINSTNIKLIPIKSLNYFSKVRRPSFSLLSKNKIKSEMGINIPFWKDSLKECLSKLSFE